MKHFNWDCECEDCMIMKAGRDLYEALKELVDIVSNVIEYHNEPLGIDSFTLQPAKQALLKAEEKC